ncbi:glycerol-3-phosphate 1-O-acyltransferase PlsY [Pelistega ratti]|uniref:glycerol-3-phosphate 1-O-acyltransferase PlsY n=1 Tax=Pelistega ratti TaxID=2652177 RepID=UPI00135C4E68|nr:glycerol-3-phosphate 1-O-acyltransferase PlsY [Pelistega ratti]
MLVLYTIIAAIIAYLIGSIPFAIITSRLFKLQDPRQFGSGNPGATNVLRSGHKIAAALTLFGDAFKGWIAVYLAQQYFPHHTTSIAIVAVAVFLGHLYSIFLSFKGGKGVATAIGVLLACDPMLAIILIIIWLLVFLLFRYSSLAALIAALNAPFLYLILSLQDYRFDGSLFIAILVISILLIYRHKANITKLLTGKEAKFSKKASRKKRH